MFPTATPDGLAASSAPARRRRSRASRLRFAAVLTIVLVLVAAGSAGVAQYVRTYWLYRGFNPPTTPVTIRELGVQKIIYVGGSAIGGHKESVYVFLPPGYAQHPDERYPVYYALHGTPGEPFDFDDVLDMGVAENVLVADHKIRPMIIVSPMGAFSPFADDEWANGVRKGSDWETYVAEDLVQAIDRTYRTIPEGADRAIAGLSEGGYGALNISIHHPGEFRVVESWSGYELADYVPAVWGPHPSRKVMDFNSPDLQVHHVASILRRDHTYFWFYCGSDDPLVTQNIQFAHTLSGLKLPYEFQIRHGGHSWKLWRSMVNPALITASEHFGRG